MSPIRNPNLFKDDLEKIFKSKKTWLILFGLWTIGPMILWFNWIGVNPVKPFDLWARIDNLPPFFILLSIVIAIALFFLIFLIFGGIVVLIIYGESGGGSGGGGSGCGCSD